MAGHEVPILRRFQLDQNSFLDRGWSSSVFKLSNDRILRIYAQGPTLRYATKRAEFTETLRDVHNIFVPRVFEVQEATGVVFTIEERVRGNTVAEILRNSSPARRRQARTALAETSTVLGRVPCDHPFFGELLTFPTIRRNTWREYLIARVDRSVQASLPHLRAHLPTVDTVLADWRDHVLNIEEPVGQLVHGDMSASNVFVDASGRAIALIDFSDLTTVGDTRVDAICAVMFLELARGAREEDRTYVRGIVGSDLSPDLERAVRLFYSFHFSPCFGLDDRVYRWCLQNLQRA